MIAAVNFIPAIGSLASLSEEEEEKNKKVEAEEKQSSSETARSGSSACAPLQSPAGGRGGPAWGGFCRRGRARCVGRHVGKR